MEGKFQQRFRKDGDFYAQWYNGDLEVIVSAPFNEFSVSLGCCGNGIPRSSRSASIHGGYFLSLC